ncbi:MAG TPA: hypothetical protein VE978_02290 [Chitinophagales bacterium]|nr:hypothetical protein [Chitinophagales bacterium]
MPQGTVTPPNPKMQRPGSASTTGKQKKSTGIVAKAITSKPAKATAKKSR